MLGNYQSFPTCSDNPICLIEKSLLGTVEKGLGGRRSESRNNPNESYWGLNQGRDIWVGEVDKGLGNI